MQVIKTLESNKRTYYCGYISKYERTEAEKEERKYMTMQKAVGVLAIITSVVMISLGAAPAVLLTLMGIALTLTKEHALCL